MNFDFFGSDANSKIISSLESFLNHPESILPASLHTGSALQLSLILIALTIGFGLAFRLFFGRKCNANQAVSVSVGVLFIYSTTIILYAFNPLNLSSYLSPLPFTLFRKDILIILPFHGTNQVSLSSQILSLIILCFIVHFLDMVLPTGKSFISWVLLRCISIILALFLNLAVNLAFNSLLPDKLAEYAPVILLFILGASIIIGLFNRLLCIVFMIMNPIMGLLYTFFFSNIIGKQLTKAVISALILCLVFYFMEYLGYTVLDITQNAVVWYMPISALLLCIWYIFDYKL